MCTFAQLHNQISQFAFGERFLVRNTHCHSRKCLSRTTSLELLELLDQCSNMERGKIYLAEVFDYGVLRRPNGGESSDHWT